MAKKVFYRQCRLEKKIAGGTLGQVSYIPEKYAIKDKVLKLCDANGDWTDGWKVLGAGSRLLEQSELPDWYQLVKGHRKATGDALPKGK
jgi:hypothetical protein